jgi:hypothetical protein
MAEGQITVEMLLIKIGQLSVQLDLANAHIVQLNEEIKKLKEKKEEKS